MHNRWIRLACLACLLTLIGTGQPKHLLAQETGDQIVETDETPTPETTTDDGAVDPSEEPDPVATPDDATAIAGASRPSAEDLGITFEPGDELVAVEDVNLREEAEADADVIEVIPEGDIVILAGDGEPVNDFLPVEVGENAGWAFLPFLVAADDEDNLAVVTEELNLRDGPSTDDEVLDTLERETEVRIVGIVMDDDDEDWTRVFVQGNDEETDVFGWTSAEFVEPVVPDDAEATPSSVTDQDFDLVTVRDASLYDAASSSAAVVTVVPFGTFALATGEASNGFVPVSVDGVSGWLSTEDIAPAEIADEITGDASGTDQTSIGETRTTTEEINLRAQPTDDAEVRLVLPAGSTVTITGGIENGYVAVLVAGVTGWVLAEYLVE